MSKPKIYEIVLICDDIGIVKEISFPNEDVSDYFIVDENLLFHVVPDSLSQALTFMHQLNETKFASNYEIRFNIRHQVETLYLSGFIKEHQKIILASTRMDHINHLNRELIKINSEQMNQFRMMLKDVAVNQKKQAKESFDYFDEITKLNNELLNSQRELAQKNHQLNQLNKDLERMATRDPLTGLYNRRLLFEKFIEEKRRSARLKYPLSMAVIDINHFKSVNDQLGHAAGDELLVRLSTLIVSLTRQSLDFAFRIGGDEFLILFANCDKISAESVMRRIDSDFKLYTDIASLAFGIIELDQHCEEDVDRCIMKADALMYEHKLKSR